MRIGELARRAGVSASRIRFYEAERLLPAAARLANGYRDYGEGDLAVIAFIDRAQNLGFTLADVARHLAAPDRHGRKAQLLKALENKLAELDAHLADVHARRATLLDAIDELHMLTGTAKAR